MSASDDILIRSDVLFDKPNPRRVTIGADQENFLHRSCTGIQAFQTCVGWILNLEIGRRSAAADFDSAGDDPRDVRALFDDPIEYFIQSTNAAMLTLHPAKLHRPIIASFSLERISRYHPNDVP